MDITRNWRLKSTRTHLLATRCPDTGAIMLPQSSAANKQEQPLYTFNQVDEVRAVEADYARAAR